MHLDVTDQNNLTCNWRRTWSLGNHFALGWNIAVLDIINDDGRHRL